jgi:tubulin-like protein CetZ
MASYVMIGVGQAGGSIVDEIFSHPYMERFAKGIAINSTMKDLMNLKHIPRSNWLGISPTKGLISGKEAGFEGQVVGGFGKDPRRAAEVMEKNFDKLLTFLENAFPAAGEWSAAQPEKKTPPRKGSKDKDLDDIEKMIAGELSSGEEEDWIPVLDSDEEEGQEVQKRQKRGHVPFVLVVLGLGGGTGSGATATLIRAIREMSQVEPTVIAVGILPATHEHAGEAGEDQADRGSLRQAWNARWALDQIEKVADGIILVDNERISFNKNVESLFPSYNSYIATSLRDLIGGPLIEEIDMSKHGEVSLPVIDIQDIVSAISFTNGDGEREPGYASLGRAVELTHRFPGYLVPMLGRREVDPVALLRLSLMKRTVAGSLPEKARKNLGFVRLPPGFLRSVDSFPMTGRVEEELGRMAELGETHFGITLTKRRVVSVTTLMTYRREDIDRLATIDRLAERYEDRTLMEAL